MVYILLGTGFEEAEALVAADVLRRGNLPVSLTGIGGSAVAGAHNITVSADIAVEDVTLAPGDAVVLPGGLDGVAAIEHSPAAMALVRQAWEDNSIRLAAICAAPTLLARAGLLGPGVRAVCYPGLEGQLTAVGVTAAMDQPAVNDSQVITGRGPGAAFDFALAVLADLASADVAESVRADLCYGA